MVKKNIMTLQYVIKQIRLFFLYCIIVMSFYAKTNAEIIRIMAANLTSTDDQSYAAPGIRIFQGLDPDVVLIQEFSYDSGTLRDFVDTAFGDDFYYFVEPGSENIPNGVVSRYPIIDSGQWDDTFVSDRDFAWAVIDIPGDVDLQVVSIHLKSGSETTQNQQANLIKNYVVSNFDLEQYIVIGGDLNTDTETASAVGTFNTFLSATGHRPVDQENNDNTSEPRTKPYDWVMPNALLEARHVPLVIGSSVYPSGLVFDSHVYTPLTEVYPVQYADSHTGQMQHMAVMKAFSTDSAQTPTSMPSATRTPTPVFSPTPTPFITPTPSPRYSPTITPTPDPNASSTPTLTPVPECNSLGCRIEMPRKVFVEGNECFCNVYVCNPESSTIAGSPVFVLLDVYGTYYFAPGFNDFSYYIYDIPQGETKIDVLSSFIWPGTGGSTGIVTWYAAMTDSAITTLVGKLDTYTFGWQ